MLGTTRPIRRAGAGEGREGWREQRSGGGTSAPPWRIRAVPGVAPERRVCRWTRGRPSTRAARRHPPVAPSGHGTQGALTFPDRQSGKVDDRSRILESGPRPRMPIVLLSRPLVSHLQYVRDPSRENPGLLARSLHSPISRLGVGEGLPASRRIMRERGRSDDAPHSPVFLTDT